MKSNNKKFLLFGKVAIIDVLIVLLICGAGAFVCWFLTRPAITNETLSVPTAQQQRDFEYTLSIESVSDQITALPKQGATVFEAETMSAIGTVVSVKTSPAYTYGPNKQTGESIKQLDSGRHRVDVTIRASSNTVSDAGIYIGDILIALGEEISFCDESFGGMSKVTALTVMEKEAAAK